MGWRGTFGGLLLLVLCAAALAAEGREAKRPAKIRTGPAVYFPIVENLDKGALLTVLKEDPDWVKVRTAAGKEGWVSVRVFSDPPKPRGYGKVVEERGLKGASSTVVTMAARGLMGTPGSSGGLLLAEFLFRLPASPEVIGEFVRALNPLRRCPESLGDVAIPWAEQVYGDPGLDEAEQVLGMELALMLLARLDPLTDTRVDGYVNQVGQAVAARSSRYDLPWRFVVFRQERPEALALPGGLVLVSTGLIGGLRDEAELAGVLGHEIAHLALAHGAARFEELPRAPDGTEPGQAVRDLAQKAAVKIRAAFKPAQEHDADLLGLALAACAGYDPEALARVLSRIEFEGAVPGSKAGLHSQRACDLELEVRNGRLAAGVIQAERFRRELLARLP